jgi:N-acylneuraminate cytidylyltransferase
MEAHGAQIDAVCLLQPTAPFRTPGQIDACVDLLERTGADSVVTIVEIPPEHNPHWVYFADPDGYMSLCLGGTDPIPRRQDLPAAYRREGSVYVARRDIVVEQNSLYGHRLMGLLLAPDAVSVNIDTFDDWRHAEMTMQRTAG